MFSGDHSHRHGACVLASADLWMLCSGTLVVLLISCEVPLQGALLKVLAWPNSVDMLCVCGELCPSTLSQYKASRHAQVSHASL